MAGKRKVVDARKDKKGNIESVLLEGNKNFTSLSKAIDMTENGQVDLVVVHTDDKKHLRTRPNDKKKDNLDDMAGD
ncbi:DUF3892 domain-containing protein [Marinomonas fungiae]|uniref:DUF3892 domain-containing protein n=1 Tax=Marinomonas fungiae TaxID=1137284 RepID=UPI003A8D8C22